MMKARDLMSPGSECAAAGDTLEQAARRLAELGVGAMPICGDDDRLIGMLSDRDIVVKAIAQGKDLATTFVRDLAEGKPVTIGADDSVGETLRTMAKARVRRLPVIDGRRLVGIVSQADIARRVSNRRSGRLLAAVSTRKPARRPRRMLALPLLLVGSAAVLYWPWKRWSQTSASSTLSVDTIVRVPVRSAYDQWTQFEEFPSFMGGVEEVRQLDDTHLHWRARVAGTEREWDAEITEQVPDQKIAWRSTSGAQNDGTVRFQNLDSASTRVLVEMALQPETAVERVGTMIGLPARRVKADLERFRKAIEQRGGKPTGEWRAEVHDDRPG